MQLSVEVSRPSDVQQHTRTVTGHALRHTGAWSHRHTHLRASKTVFCSQTPVNVWADVSPLPTGRAWGPWRRRKEGKAPHLSLLWPQILPVSEALCLP